MECGVLKYQVIMNKCRWIGISFENPLMQTNRLPETEILVLFPPLQKPKLSLYVSRNIFFEDVNLEKMCDAALSLEYKTNLTCIWTEIYFLCVSRRLIRVVRHLLWFLAAFHTFYSEQLGFQGRYSYYACYWLELLFPFLHRSLCNLFPL